MVDSSMRGATCRDSFQFKSTNLAATSKRAVALTASVESFDALPGQRPSPARAVI
jgi:hypothetical protein